LSLALNLLTLTADYLIHLTTKCLCIFCKHASESTPGLSPASLELHSAALPHALHHGQPQTTQVFKNTDCQKYRYNII